MRLKAMVAAALCAVTLAACDGNLIVTNGDFSFDANPGDTVVEIGVGKADCDDMGGQHVRVNGIGRACVGIDF